MMCAKFPSKEIRDACVGKLRKASPSRDSNRSWFAEEAPIEERQCKMILFGTKRYLCEEWEYDKERGGEEKRRRRHLLIPST